MDIKKKVPSLTKYILRRKPISLLQMNGRKQMCIFCKIQRESNYYLECPGCLILPLSPAMFLYFQHLNTKKLQRFKFSSSRNNNILKKENIIHLFLFFFFNLILIMFLYVTVTCVISLHNGQHHVTIHLT